MTVWRSDVHTLGEGRGGPTDSVDVALAQYLDRSPALQEPVPSPQPLTNAAIGETVAQHQHDLAHSSPPCSTPG